LEDNLPDPLLSALSELAATSPEIRIVAKGSPQAAARIAFDPTGGETLFHQVFAVAARFDAQDPGLRWHHLVREWRGQSSLFPAIAVLDQTLPTLEQVLGEAGPTVQTYSTADDIVAAAWQDVAALTILPFDLLDPSLTVFAIDGQNPVENSSGFYAERYPLVARIALHIDGTLPGNLAPPLMSLLEQTPASNRRPDRLTVVAMTGVTAMVRYTAAQMDRYGSAWPADEVGPELASADITVISNEVPFVEGCETNTEPDNLVFCSKPEYMETLIASGADIIGLTGNHQNDFGLENALKSLDLYADSGLSLYGGGRNKEAALSPLIVEHNGNRLAFLGANSYGPPVAWATDFAPGSAPFDLNIMSAAIRNLKEENMADVVLAELQYQESYATDPLVDQRKDFGALIRAGADVVTGVQSHVPQALEFLEDGLILYGLGNLYFDQMWSEDTRRGMVVKHTIYQGRHLSTQILPTVLHDYGQPHWATPRERTEILKSVFSASRWPDY
jgi:poly-gamma-glutamate synthesis protein (capsule biosynthesis protein)